MMTSAEKNPQSSAQKTVTFVEPATISTQSSVLQNEALLNAETSQGASLKDFLTSLPEKERTHKAGATLSLVSKQYGNTTFIFNPKDLEEKNNVAVKRKK